MVYRYEDAIEADAQNKPWEFEHDGDVYVLPSDFDVRVAAKLTTGDLDGALRQLLGPEQWQRLEASPAVFGMRKLSAVLQAWAGDIGVDLGEFVASPPSSKRTVTPSKRTSNGSTASRSRGSTRTRKS
jgi:hypothetical protein